MPFVCMLSSDWLMRCLSTFAHLCPSWPLPVAGLPHLPIVPQVPGPLLDLVFQPHFHLQHPKGQLPTLDKAMVAPQREDMPHLLVLWVGISSLLTLSAHHSRYENKQAQWTHLWKGELEGNEDFLLELIQVGGGKSEEIVMSTNCEGVPMDHA